MIPRPDSDRGGFEPQAHEFKRIRIKNLAFNLGREKELNLNRFSTFGRIYRENGPSQSVALVPRR